MIVIDCDFLSSFLKIDKLDLIKKFYKVNKVYITAAVVNELSKTTLISKLPDWLEVIPTALEKELITIKDFNKLGEGEKSCIMLAKKENALFLVSDNKA